MYKVYTIGDCYVAMGLINANKRNYYEEAINVINLGLDMVEIIKSVRKEINFEELHMRIGIHTGQIYGGIIGTDIVRYDIYGQDVLIANKMESNGVEGRVMISENTRSLIEPYNSKNHKYELQFHKIVKIEKLQIEQKAFLVSRYSHSDVEDDSESV